MKREPIDLKSPSYTPDRLIEATFCALGLRNDNQLARALEMCPGNICRIRHRKTAVSDRLLIDIADRTGWSVQYMRSLAGIPFDGPAPVNLVAFSENRLQAAA